MCHELFRSAGIREMCDGREIADVIAEGRLYQGSCFFRLEC